MKKIVEILGNTIIAFAMFSLATPVYSGDEALMQQLKKAEEAGYLFKYNHNYPDIEMLIRFPGDELDQLELAVPGHYVAQQGNYETSGVLYEYGVAKFWIREGRETPILRLKDCNEIHLKLQLWNNPERFNIPSKHLALDPERKECVSRFELSADVLQYFALDQKHIFMPYGSKNPGEKIGADSQVYFRNTKYTAVAIGSGGAPAPKVSFTETEITIRAISNIDLGYLVGCNGYSEDQSGLYKSLTGTPVWEKKRIGWSDKRPACDFDLDKKKLHTNDTTRLVVKFYDDVFIDQQVILTK